MRTYGQSSFLEFYLCRLKSIFQLITTCNISFLDSDKSLESNSITCPSIKNGCNHRHFKLLPFQMTPVPKLSIIQNERVQLLQFY